jgi:hypothetical protein
MTMTSKGSRVPQNVIRSDVLFIVNWFFFLGVAVRMLASKALWIKILLEGPAILMIAFNCLHIVFYKRASNRGVAGASKTTTSFTIANFLENGILRLGPALPNFQRRDGIEPSFPNDISIFDPLGAKIYLVTSELSNL